MRKDIENQILEKRHYFIYGYENENRKKAFEDCIKNNPVVVDEDRPMVIYLDSVGISKTKRKENTEKDKIQILAREHCSFTIIDAILQEILKNVDIEKESARIENFLNHLGRVDGYSTNNILEYAKQIRSSRNAYYEVLKRYLEIGCIEDFMSKLSIPFIMLEYTIKKYREMLNNNEHFSVIVDNKDNLSIWSQQAINNLVCSRINGDISMKVVTDPDAWNTYYAQNGVVAESVHDYGVAELDGSLRKHVMGLKKIYDGNNE